MTRRRWSQILLGLGIGILIRTIITYLQQHDVGKATFSLGLALLIIAVSLYLLRQP